MQFAGPSLSAWRYSHDIKNIHDCVSCHRITLCLFPGEITAQKFVCLRTVDKIAVACGKGGSAKQTGREKKNHRAIACFTHSACGKKQEED